MKNETNKEYAVRAAMNTYLWLKDRSAHCHPVVYANIAHVREMLAEYLADGSKTALKAKLNKAARGQVQLLLEGYVWAKMERAA